MMQHREDRLRAALLDWAQQPMDEGRFGQVIELRDDAAELKLSSETSRRQLAALLEAGQALRENPNGVIHLNGHLKLDEAKGEAKPRRAPYLWLAAAAILLLALTLLLPLRRDKAPLVEGPQPPVVQQNPAPPNPDAPAVPEDLTPDQPAPNDRQAPVVQDRENRAPFRERPNPDPQRNVRRNQPAPEPYRPIAPAPLTEVGYIAAAVGEPTIQNGSDAAAVVTIQQKLYPGMRVSTGDIDRLELRLFDRVTVRLDFNTEIVIPRDERDQIEMLSGQIWASVETMPDGRTFAVETPVATATVLGTKFGLELQGEKPETMKAILRVEEGLVRFGNAFGSVQAGEQTETSAAAGSKPLEPKRVQVLAYWRTGDDLNLRWTERLTPAAAIPMLDGYNTVASFNWWGVFRADVMKGFETFEPDDQRRVYMVTDLVPDGTAERAGLRLGDLIIAYQGVTIPDDLRMSFPGHNSPTWTVWRNGQSFDLVIEREPHLPGFHRSRENQELTNPLYFELVSILRKGDVDAALAHLLKLQDSVRDPSLDHNLGLIYQVKDDMGSAQRHLSRAIKGAPENPLYRMNYAHLMTAIGNLRRSQEEAYRAMELAPKWLQPAYLIQQIAQVENRTADAEAILHVAIANEPRQMGAYYALHYLLHRREAHDDLIALGHKAIDAVPDDRRGYTIAMWGYDGKKNRAKALEYATKALEVAPVAECYHDHAVMAARAERLDLAVASARRALSLHDDVTTRFNLGQILYNQGEYGEAVSEFHEVIRMQPELAEAHERAAWCYWHLDNLKEAAAHARAALAAGSEVSSLYEIIIVHERLEANYQEVIRLRAIYRSVFDHSGETLVQWYAAMAEDYWKLENYQKAEEYARQALELDPQLSYFKDPQTFHPNPYSILSGILSRTGRADEVLQVLKDGLLHLPDDRGLLLSISTYRLAHKEEVREALEAIERLHGRESEDFLKCLRGRALFLLGNHEEAVRLLREGLVAPEPVLGIAVASPYGTPLIYEACLEYRFSWLGEALEAVGERAGAIAAYESALLHNPELTTAKEALSRLRPPGAGVR
jgi:tetratricopeptide (TPR) repeat protein